MQRKKTFNSLGFIAGFFILMFFFTPFIGWAQEEGCSEHDIRGWAWSDNIGWISLSCENGADINNIDYGIDVDGEGVLSGWAWSDNIGWISFNTEDLSGCPEGLCVAEFDGDSLRGWAKIIDTNEDGVYFGDYDEWISLSGEAEDGEEYKVEVNLTENRLDGYAWGGTVVGWIEFGYYNGMEEGIGEGGEVIGGKYISLMNAENLPDTFNDITFSAWIKWDGLGSQEYSGIYGFSNESPSSAVRFEVRDGGDLYLGLNNNIQLASNVIRRGRWTNVTFSYNGRTNIAKIFVDGRVVSSRERSADLRANSLVFHGVGRSHHEYESNFNGHIANVRLYNAVFE